MRAAANLKMQNTSLAVLTPLLAVFFTFVAYAYWNDETMFLNPVMVYTTSALYDALRFPIGMAPQTIRALSGS